MGERAPTAYTQTLPLKYMFQKVSEKLVTRVQVLTPVKYTSRHVIIGFYLEGSNKKSKSLTKNLPVWYNTICVGTNFTMKIA